VLRWSLGQPPPHSTRPTAGGAAVLHLGADRGEPLALVHRDRRVVVAVDVEDHLVDALGRQVAEADGGQHGADATAGRLRVRRDDVDLAVRRLLVAVHLRPVEAQERRLRALVLRDGEEQARRVEPRLGNALTEVLRGQVSLLGVVRERRRVDLQERRLVGRPEGADPHAGRHRRLADR
jgi:hypothetical protein